MKEDNTIITSSEDVKESEEICLKSVLKTLQNCNSSIQNKNSFLEFNEVHELDARTLKSEQFNKFNY